MADPERAPAPSPEERPGLPAPEPAFVLGHLRFPRLPQHEATPRFLEVIEAMLADPGKIGAAGLRAAIETLESRDQLHDPFPDLPCRYYERRFAEEDTALGGTAFYLLRVLKLLGKEDVVPAVSLRLEGLSLPAGAVVDRARAHHLAGESGAYEGSFYRIAGGSSLRIAFEVMDDFDCILASNPRSSSGGIQLRVWEDRAWYRRDAYESKIRRAGALLGSRLSVHSYTADSPVRVRLLELNEAGSRRLEVENRSGSPLWLFLLKPLPGG